MRFPTRVFVLLLFLTPRWSANCQEPQDTVPISVKIEVVDQVTALPLNNVVVRLSEIGIQTLSDSAGFVQLSDLRPGMYRLTLTRQGYLPKEGDLRIFRAGTFRVGLDPIAVSEEPPPGQILGRVLAGESGDRLQGAMVSLSGTAVRRETNPNGIFRFSDVPPGYHFLRVEYLGRETVEDSIFVPEGKLLEVEVPLSIEPIQLEGFTVTAHSKWLSTSGFFRRMEAGGYDGRQWGSSQLAMLDPEILRDALETVPGVNQAGINGYVSRGRCRMTVFVDGFEMDRSFDLDMIAPERVEAMEVFNGRGSTMPVEYAGYCGVILIWLEH